MEQWDAYDVHFNRLDKTLLRGEPIPSGYFHGVAIIVVQHDDGTFLMMHRDPNKEVDPDLWEPGASGSILKGESFIQGAFRELREETGLIVDNMQYMRDYCYHEYQTLYKIYATTYHGDKDKVIVQVGETDAYRWVESTELFNSVEEDRCVIMFPDVIEECVKRRAK